jgi:cyclopropane-fatty-acyl-phospholipid synthase
MSDDHIDNHKSAWSEEKDPPQGDAHLHGLSPEQRLAMAVLKAVGNPPIRITVGDGVSIATRHDVVAAVRVRDHPTLLKLLLYPELNFGDAYMDGSVVIEGDLVRVLEVCMQARPQARASEAVRRIASLLQRSRMNSLAGSRENIHHHYDLGNEFYSLWLDREMVYTCAYFSTPDATLEEAQLAKLDYVCRKLRLRPGETVIEAGSGWGAFAVYAATHYGVHVKAFNISREQIAFARERALAFGVQDRVEVIEDDYRNISSGCDAFVSIGMLEHVGRDHYADLGQVIDRCLSESGRGLIHSIGQSSPSPLNPWIEKRIFPGAYPPALSEMMEIFEPWHFSVLDVENLRPHYALTVEHWLKRFEASRDRVQKMYGESFVRAWRFYLSGSMAAFRMGALQVFQVLFNRLGNQDAARTRDYLNKATQ